MTVAILDIGSNTSKVLVARKDDCGLVTEVAQKSLPCRLAKGLGNGNLLLSEASIVTTVKVVSDLLTFSKEFSPYFTKIVATEALRRLSNADVFIERIEKEFGILIDVISGSQEASYIARGLLTDPAISSLTEFHAIDLGGGSLEIMRVVNGTPQDVTSLPLGAVVLAEKFLGNLSLKPLCKDILALQNYISQMLKDDAFSITQKCDNLVGTGGSILFIRRLISSFKNIEFFSNSNLSFSDIEKITNQVNSLSLSERTVQFDKLPRDRADVFPAALIVVMELMKFFKLENLTHSFHNLRFGLADELLTDLDPSH
jgi:exopolyphosphatase/guanosine-5'-triphosphate,3'-diphosphate pyrophosphatase